MSPESAPESHSFTDGSTIKILTVGANKMDVILESTQITNGPYVYAVYDPNTRKLMILEVNISTENEESQTKIMIEKTDSDNNFMLNIITTDEDNKINHLVPIQLVSLTKKYEFEVENPSPLSGKCEIVPGELSGQLKITFKDNSHSASCNIPLIMDQTTSIKTDDLNLDPFTLEIEPVS